MAFKAIWCHEPRRQATMPNTWRDTIAVAERLVRNQYTAPQRLAVLWQSTKFANRLAHATRGGPVLMRLDYALGHGAGGTRAQQQEQTADIWSFMLWQFGLPEFQPQP